MARLPKSRDALLAAAERIFAEKGLAGARTEQIASEAKVNKAMLHYYFDTKEKLYGAVLENLMQQFRTGVIEPVNATKDPAAALFEYVERHITFLARHPNFPRLVQREMMTGGPRIRVLIQNFQGPLSQTLRTKLRAGIRAGEFRKVDVDHAIVTVGGVTAFYFIVAPVIGMILQADPLTPKMIARRKRSVLDFIRHGLLTEAGIKKFAAKKKARKTSKPTRKATRQRGNKENQVAKKPAAKKKVKS